MRRGLAGLLVAIVGVLAAGAIVLVMAGGGGADARSASKQARNAELLRAYGRLPLRFEANKGQSDAQVRFLARTPGATVFLTPTGATLALSSSKATDLRTSHKPRSRAKSALVGLRVAGGDPHAKVSGVDRLAGVSNYLTGSDPSRWRTGVPGYGRVSYRSVYPGIDLSFYGRQRQLEYDFDVAPGADVGRIALAATGAKRLRIDRSGDLVLDTTVGAVRQRAPVIYQSVDGHRRPVSGGYVLKGHGRLGFRVGPYDHSRTLVIDPVLDYGTYLGATGIDEVDAVAVDSACSSSCPAYVTGATTATDFPVNNALQGSHGGPGTSSDAFVAKINADGSALEYSTYLGGSANDNGSGVAVDSSGRAFVTGSTSGSFPTTAGAFQSARGGSTDAFLTVLKPDGSGLDYSTFLGGTADDSGAGVAVRGGKAYVTGSTSSAGFPTTVGAFDRTCDTPANPCASGDAFAAEVDPAASSAAASLVYSTFLGGGGNDAGKGIAADQAGAAYVTGNTSSNDFPGTSGKFQPALSAGGSDVFVAKVKPAGSGLDYATHLGGNGSSVAGGIAVDPSCASSCSTAVTGETYASDFPTTTTPGAFQGASAGGDDAFVTQLNTDGSKLDYSTYLGGAGSYTFGTAIGVHGGKVYATGGTATRAFPAKDPVERARGARNDGDAYLAAFDPTASKDASLIYSTRLGGSLFDNGTGVAVDGSGSAYVGAATASVRGDFPTTPRALQPGPGLPGKSPGDGFGDGFVMKISPVNPGLPYVSGVAPLAGSVSGGQSVKISGRDFVGVTGVRFGGTPVNFTIDSLQQITVISPPHAPGEAAVTVSTIAGESPANPITRFLYGQGQFRPTANPSTLGTTPVVLKDGRVLLFSPKTFLGTPAKAQIYDPKSEAWTDTAAPTRLPAYSPDIRSRIYSATLLANGKVLVFMAASRGTLADSAELYDPAGGGSWTNTASSPTVKRQQSTATRLDGPACRSASPPSYCGNVLIVGGQNPAATSTNLTSAELYNPTTDSFTATKASTKVGHRQAAAVLLDDAVCHGGSPPSYCGKVLVAGGFNPQGVPIADAELYDPGSDSWTDAAPFKQARARHNLVQLPDGRVLESGGQDVAGTRVEDAELYDPVSNTWNLTNTYPGVYPTIPTLLPDGNVLVTEAANGPNSNTSSDATAYLFDPTLRDGKGDWVPAGLKSIYAATSGAVLLTSDPLTWSADPKTFKGDAAMCGDNCGKALVVGADADSPPAVLGAADLFTPSPRFVPPGGTPPGGGGSTSSGLTSSGSTGGSDSTAPGVCCVRVSPNPFVVGGRTPIFGSAAAKRKRHKRGTTFRYTLSEAATVKITIAQRRAGRRRGKRCVAPTRTLRRARKCTRVTVRGTLTRTSRQGKNAVAFSGRIGSRRLSPGRYQATLTATDAARNTSKPKTVSFTIVKR